MSCKGCIRTEEKNLGCYIKRQVESLLVTVKTHETIMTESVLKPEEYKGRKKR